MNSGILSLQPVELPKHIVGNVNGSGALLLPDSDGNNVFAVVASDGIRFLRGLVYLGDIRKMNGISIAQSNGDRFQSICILIAVVRADTQILRSYRNASRGNRKVGGAYDLRNLFHGQMILFQLLSVQFNPNIALLSTGKGYLTYGAKLFKFGNNIVFYICIKVFIGLAADCQGNHRRRVDVQLQNCRFFRVVR